MIQARINNKNLEIFVDVKEDAQKLQESLSAFEPGYKNNTLYRMGKWNGKRKFYNIRVLQEGWVFITAPGFQKRIEDLFNIKIDSPKLQVDEAYTFLGNIIKELPFKPYKHQMKMFLGLASRTTHLAEASVGAGKSLVLYMLSRFYRKKGYKVLCLVPTIDLVNQLKDDFEDYNATPDFLDSIQQIGGEFKQKDIKKPLVISTWQSAHKADLSGFDVILNDECLHPDTLINTKNGKEKIKDLSKGDIVWTLNDNNELELKPIVKVHKNISSEQMYQIETEKGILRITGNHKVNTQRGWVRADELTLTDEIKDIDGNCSTN